MKGIIKVSLSLVLVFIMLFGVIQIVSNASGYDSAMANLIDKDYEDKTNTSETVNNVTATVITTIRIVGVCIAIVILLVLAMKYMTAAPGDKADIKKSAIQYVVGAIVLFGVVGILTIISKVAGVISK